MRILVINAIVTLLLFAIPWLGAGAADNVPNFNYPKTVMKEADKSLDKALKNGNHADVVRYLIQSTIAEAQISSDNTPGILSKIDSVAALETDSAAIATMHYLKAVVYNSYFAANAYSIAQRKSVAGSTTGIDEWCKDNFLEAITESLSKALQNNNALLATPIEEYVKVDGELTATVYPTLLDMISYRGIEMLEYVDNYRRGEAAFGSDASKRANEFIDSTFDLLTAVHKTEAAPYITAALAREQRNRNGAGTLGVAKSLYEQFASDPACFIALERYVGLLGNDKEAYKLLNEYLDRFPKSAFAPNARNIIGQITQKAVVLNYKTSFTSADSIAIKVEARNVASCKLLVFRVPSDVEMDVKLTRDRSRLQLVASTTIEPQGVVPFADTLDVKLKPLPYGRYIVLPDYDNALEKSAIYPQEFRVTDISLFHTNSNGGVKVFAVNAITGEPLKDVYINKVTKYDLPQLGRVAANRTNAEGYCLVKDSDSRMRNRVVAMKGDDRYGMGVYISEYGDYESNNVSVRIFTDLGVYRPGETVHYSAICYKVDRDSRNVVKNFPVALTLYDANGKEVATDSLITDEYGRVAGEFAIPTDRMNGRFRIALMGENAYMSHFFPVSEYKTPTFFVEFDGDQQSYARNTDVTITGRAEYFSGVPVSNAVVSLRLSYQQWNWWYRAGLGVLSFVQNFDVVTDGKGEFSITIPKELLNDEELPGRVQFNLEAAVTDDAGETQSATKLYWIGKTRSIEATGSGDFTFEASHGVINLPINVRTSDPADTLIVCNYAISGKAGLKGSFRANAPSIDVSSLPSGEYKLNITIEGDSTVDFDADMVLFRLTDSESPVKSPLWIPQCQLSVSDKNEASLLLGNSYDAAHVYCIAATKKGIVKETWLRYDKGLHKFTIKIPQEEDEYVDLTFITYKENQAHTWSHRFASVMNCDTLHIMPVAFRDNLVPGTPETWQFRLVNQDGKLRTGAMICDMYDKALDMIEPHQWNFTPQGWYGQIYNVGVNYVYGANLYAYLDCVTEKTQAAILPDLDFYGLNYNGRVYVRGVGVAPVMMAKNAHAEREYASADLALAESVVVSNDEVSEVEQSAIADAGGATGISQLDNVQMRTADVKNALWRPSLVTDTDGNVSVAFDAPLFNTTWLFKAIAYTQDLHTASMVQEVVTRKPIMVRASLPRFVRNGDKATLSSMLMNATDSVQHCTAVVELFDVETGDVVMSESFEKSLDAQGSVALDIEWTVPADVSVIGYRVKAATAAFGDGEQHLLTVLPSVSPVIEATPFYLTDNVTYDLALEGKKCEGGRLLLEFCSNPVWYCVTALPSIKQDSYLTASELIHSLYAVAVAQGVAASNPEIKEAVDSWLNDENDSTLVSNLSKNGDLKIGTLLASPWISEADRQTLRMQSIGELFDSTAVAAETNRIITKLRDLQMSDGGWTWFWHSGCKSSQYVTMQVLQLMGELNHLGYLTDNVDIKAMSEKAVAYLDRCIAKDYDLMTDKERLSGFYGYVYVRSLFPDCDFTADARKVYDRTVKYMKKNWGEAAGLSNKAYCAMTLYRSGERKTARAIMESVLQYSISSDNGIYWDNFNNGSDRGFGKVAVTATLLQAFGEVTDDTETIDGIRKWLLLQKQSTDWGNSSMAADAVYSILSTGTEWIGEQTLPTITVNGETLDCGTTDKYLGYFRKQVEPRDGKFELSIDRHGATAPAWGAVYHQYSAKMDEVKAAKTDDVSIEKQVCRLDGGKLDKKAVLAEGDKVLVRFVIKNSRDLEFVTLNDERAACCEPADQLSGYHYADGVGYYLETKDSATRLFFNYLPKGTHIITYEVTVTSTGTYNLGVATIQSQYAPQITAHSAGGTIEVK